MTEFEFSLRHDLHLEEAEECLFDLLDDFEDHEEFDAIEWDDRKGIAFLSNDDMEVEISVDDQEVGVWASLLEPALARRRDEIQEDLEGSIREFFGLGRPRRRSQSSRGGRRPNRPPASNRAPRGRMGPPAERVDIEMIRVEESKRIPAAILAFFLGNFGVHRFFLGQPGLGILYLAFFWTLIPGFVAFIEFIIFLTMSDEAFIEKYQM